MHVIVESLIKSYKVYIISYVWLEVGGVVQALVLPPNREIDFDCACVCVACVRASERSCVREMIPQWLGLAVRICGVPSRPVPTRPGGGPDSKFELFEF